MNTLRACQQRALAVLRIVRNQVVRCERQQSVHGRLETRPSNRSMPSSDTTPCCCVRGDPQVAPRALDRPQARAHECNTDITQQKSEVCRQKHR